MLPKHKVGLVGSNYQQFIMGKSSLCKQQIATLSVIIIEIIIAHENELQLSIFHHAIFDLGWRYILEI